MCRPFDAARQAYRRDPRGRVLERGDRLAHDPTPGEAAAIGVAGLTERSRRLCLDPVSHSEETQQPSPNVGLARPAARKKIWEMLPHFGGSPAAGALDVMGACDTAISGFEIDT